MPAKQQKQLSFLKSLDKSVTYPSIKVGTDCSGIEAPIQALKLLNVKYEHMFSCDNDENTRISCDANDKPPAFVYTDIMTRDHSKLPYVDLYVAGFPCQTFSMLGKREGFDNALKGTIFFECYDVIRKVKPKIFLLENVKGLINHDSGATFKTIMVYLKKLKGYKIYWDMYNTKDYGIPQNRERVYIVGLMEKHFSADFVTPAAIPLKITVQSIIEPNIPQTSIYGRLTEHKLSLLKELQASGRIDKMSNPWCVNLNVSSVKRTNPMRDICPCLLAGNGGDCVYYYTPIQRRLTPREYLRLQGYPDSYKIAVSDGKMYKQVGNSMSTNILCFIFQEIFRNYK